MVLIVFVCVRWEGKVTQGLVGSSRSILRFHARRYPSAHVSQSAKLAFSWEAWGRIVGVAFGGIAPPAAQSLSSSSESIVSALLYLPGVAAGDSMVGAGRSVFLRRATNFAAIGAE